MMRPISLLSAAGVLVVLASFGNAVEGNPKNTVVSGQKANSAQFVCKSAPQPVQSLSFGSRYAADSKTRSDFDQASNAEVNKQLKPIENFITQLSKMANAAFVSEDGRQARVDCVVEWLATWTDAGALKGLESDTVKLAIPARFAGIAFAYRQVKSVGQINQDKQAKIEAWLEERAKFLADFFDNEAPPKAARNNLRLWAGLAATETGLATGSSQLVDWGAASNEMVICEANPDGSLPLEMGRGRLALHYQLHAVGPMVLTASLLEKEGRAGFAVCGGKISTIVDFTVNALKNPQIVDGITGKTQTFSAGQEKIASYQMAWAEPYLQHFHDPDLDQFVARFRPMAHAKLGGNLTEIYAR